MGGNEEEEGVRRRRGVSRARRRGGEGGRRGGERGGRRGGREGREEGEEVRRRKERRGKRGRRGRGRDTSVSIPDLPCVYSFCPWSFHGVPPNRRGYRVPLRLRSCELGSCHLPWEERRG